MACLIGLDMLGEKDAFCSQLSPLPEVLPPPEKGMKPEDPKDPDKKSGHENEGPIEYRVAFRVIMSGMGHPQSKIGIGPLMTFSTGFEQPFLRDKGFRILRRKNTVKTVAIGTPCHKARVSQFFNLSMVTLVIGLGRNQKDLVSFHHLLIGMTFLANLGMELLAKCNHFAVIPLQERNLMETMAITAGRRIRISVEGGFAVDALRITIVGMAGRTRLNHAHLIPFPGRQFVNLFVTIFALNIINEMGAGIMLCRLFLMATMAGDRLAMDLCPFLVDMLFHIDDVPVTTVTGVCSMH
jgi:hypothetical protein